MKVKCTNCHKTINIPDEKIIPGEVFTFNCPNCKTPLSAGADRKEQTGPALPSLGDVPDTTPAPRPLDETQDIPVPALGERGIPPLPEEMDAIENELDVLGEGKYRALVADTENIDRISPVLRKMSYVITTADSHDEAIQKLTFNKYDLLVINERFAGCDPAGNALHRYVEPMTMDVRRKMFVVMIGKSFKTLDNMSAFVRSVNLVVNEGDFTNFELILKKAMNDNAAFYRIYNQMLVETGKEVAG